MTKCLTRGPACALTDSSREQSFFFRDCKLRFQKGKKAGVVLGGAVWCLPLSSMRLSFSIELFEWWSLTLQSSIWNTYQEPLFHYWMFLRNKERSLSVWAVIVFISRTVSWSFRRCLTVTLLKLWRRRHSSLFSLFRCLQRRCWRLWSIPGLTCLKSFRQVSCVPL